LHDDRVVVVVVQVEVASTERIAFFLSDWSARDDIAILIEDNHEELRRGIHHRDADHLVIAIAYHVWSESEGIELFNQLQVFSSGARERYRFGTPTILVGAAKVIGCYPGILGDLNSGKPIERAFSGLHVMNFFLSQRKNLIEKIHE
jgi:hypothetical protein